MTLIATEIVAIAAVLIADLAVRALEKMVSAIKP